MHECPVEYAVNFGTEHIKYSNRLNFSEMKCDSETLSKMTYTALPTDCVSENITAPSVVKNAVINEVIIVDYLQ